MYIPNLREQDNVVEQVISEEPSDLQEDTRLNISAAHTHPDRMAQIQDCSDCSLVDDRRRLDTVLKENNIFLQQSEKHSQAFESCKLPASATEHPVKPVSPRSRSDPLRRQRSGKKLLKKLAKGERKRL